MRVTFWGTRGSLATPDPDMQRLGGNTSCVEVRGDDGTVLVLDAGTGIRRLGRALAGEVERVDILLTHLHMDHIQGLGFFAPVFMPGVEVHIWGPPSSTQTVEERLARYLSPPLFPVHLRDVHRELHIRDVVGERIRIGGFRIDVAFVCHPNPTVGFRISDGRSAVTYLPDHEPALGTGELDRDPAWVSGYRLAQSTTVLIHDAQYSDAEYLSHMGWGHSSVRHACQFAAMAGANMLVPFHHDPSHSDDEVEQIVREAVELVNPEIPVVVGAEGMTLVLDGGTVRRE